MHIVRKTLRGVQGSMHPAKRRIVPEAIPKEAGPAEGGLQAAAAPAGGSAAPAGPSMTVREMAEFTEKHIGLGRRLYVSLDQPGTTIRYKQARELAWCAFARQRGLLTHGLMVQLVEEQKRRLEGGSVPDKVPALYCVCLGMQGECGDHAACMRRMAGMQPWTSWCRGWRISMG